MKNTITRQVYRPETGGNPTSHYLAEVRENGWLVNYKYCGSPQEAQSWVETASTEMSEQTVRFYLKVLKEIGQ